MIAVHDGDVDRALVPIENSLEGSVNPTLDAIAFETEDVVIVGELRWPVHLHLVAAGPLELGEIRAVVSHPQASGQCGRFLRECAAGRAGGGRALDRRRGAPGRGRVRVRLGGDRDPRRGRPLRLHGAARGRRGRPRQRDALRLDRPRGHRARRLAGDRFKTALVFWGAGSAGPGWLVRCLAEFAEREVNLTRIESRPRRQRLGEYMFFLDLDGRADDDAVASAIDGLRAHADVVRVLGSFPAA